MDDLIKILENCINDVVEANVNSIISDKLVFHCQRHYMETGEFDNNSYSWPFKIKFVNRKEYTDNKVHSEIHIKLPTADVEPKKLYINDDNTEKLVRQTVENIISRLIDIRVEDIDCGRSYIKNNKFEVVLVITFSEYRRVRIFWRQSNPVGLVNPDTKIINKTLEEKTKIKIK